MEAGVDRRFHPPQSLVGTPRPGPEQATSKAVCGGLWGPAAKTCSPTSAAAWALGVVEVGLQPAGRLDAGRPDATSRAATGMAPVGEQRGGYQVGRASGIPAVGGLEQVVGHLQRAGDEGDAGPQEGFHPPAWRMIAAARSPSPARRAFHARVSASAVEAPGDRSGSTGPGRPDHLEVGLPGVSCGGPSRGGRRGGHRAPGASTSNTPVRWPARSSWKFMCEAEEQQAEQADE